MNKTENEIDVFSMGRGKIPRMVMSDRNLTVEAKAIYCYIAACIGAVTIGGCHLRRSEYGKGPIPEAQETIG
ncbi:hypothetical protein [Trichococcus sp.]|uniref:hypothetical protein n=1 Tax=Trichococcus sp. TaxID=1985464 RepID=UPI003C7D1234